jgi:eukaryotic-like serine/threonine-protein kinase
VLLARKGGGTGGTEESTTGTIALPATSASAVTVASDPVPTSSSSPATTPPDASSLVPPSPPRTSGTGTTSNTPRFDPKADEECKATMRLALGGNTGLAVKRFASCAGPGRGAASAAIDASAKRAVATKGCGAKADAMAAASIGMTGAKSQLEAKRCR